MKAILSALFVSGVALASGINTPTPWSGILNPSGNLSLTMGADTSLFTFNATTGLGVDLFKLTDTLNNTGTGSLLHSTTASGSSALPFEADSNGNGIEVNSSGNLVNVGTGLISFTTSVSSPTYTGSGAVVIKPGADSTSSVEVQSNGGTVLERFDSTNTRVCFVCTTAPSDPVDFGNGSLATATIVNFVNSSGSAGINVSSSIARFTSGGGANVGLQPQGVLALDAFSTGDITIGTTTDSNYRLDVTKSGSTGTFRVFDTTAATGATSMLVQGGATANDATTNKLFRINTGGGTSEAFSVQGNGIVNLDGYSAQAGQAACIGTSGQLGHCTTTVGAGGACTCTVP